MLFNSYMSFRYWCYLRECSANLS